MFSVTAPGKDSYPLDSRFCRIAQSLLALERSAAVCIPSSLARSTGCTMRNLRNARSVWAWLSGLIDDPQLDAWDELMRCACSTGNEADACNARRSLQGVAKDLRCGTADAGRKPGAGRVTRGVGSPRRLHHRSTMTDGVVDDAANERGSGFDDVDAAPNDAAMVAELSQRLDHATLARALGVKPSELDMIGAGYPANRDAAARLRVLYRLASTTDDLTDPSALVAALGLTDSSEQSLTFALFPRLKTFLIAFVVIDVLVFLGFTLVLVLLR
jgi:hypothetical protein